MALRPAREMTRYAIAVAALVLPTAAAGATLNVSTTDDIVANDGACSLREAISSANTNAPSGAAAGECPAGTVALDRIVLGARKFVFTRQGANEDANATGDLDLLGETTLVGSGANLTQISAARLDRVMTVGPGVILRVEGVTITGGQAPNGGPGAPSGGNGGRGNDGGGILNSGTLTVVSSDIIVNAAGNGGDGGVAAGAAGTASASTGGGGGAGLAGQGGPGGHGGGIYAGSGTKTTILNSRITGNAAGRGGSGGTGTGGAGGAGTGVGVSVGGKGGVAGGGTAGQGGSGGGIYSAAQLSLEGAAFLGNASGDGGVGGGATGGRGGASLIANYPGGGGDAFGGPGGSGGQGGGVYASGSDVSVVRSLFKGNTTGNGARGGSALAGVGGTGSPSTGVNGTPYPAAGGNGGDGAGILIQGSLFGEARRVIENVTLTGNITGNGGVGAGAGGFGGNGAGLATLANVTLRHATIVGNANGVSGPDKGGVALVGAAISRGGGSVTVSASIVVGYCGGGAIVNGLGNVVSQGSGTCPGVEGDPLLDGLASNGGPTDTMRIRVPSAAIDAVPAGTTCAATDQRGVARPSGVRCDAGAYEFSPPTAVTGRTGDIAPTTVTLNGTVGPVGSAGTFTFQYGPTTAYGSQTTPRPTEGGAVSAPLAGLAGNTTYHVRLVATTADGVGNGADVTFTTAATPTGGSVAGSGGKPRADAGAPTLRSLRSPHSASASGRGRRSATCSRLPRVSACPSSESSPGHESSAGA